MAAIFLPISVSRDRESRTFFDETSRDQDFYNERLLKMNTFWQTEIFSMSINPSGQNLVHIAIRYLFNTYIFSNVTSLQIWPHCEVAGLWPA